MKIYRVEDDVEMPMLYDNLESAVESVKELVDAIEVGNTIKITCVEMSKKKYESIPEY